LERKENKQKNVNTNENSGIIHPQIHKGGKLENKISSHKKKEKVHLKVFKKLRLPKPN